MKKIAAPFFILLFFVLLQYTVVANPPGSFFLQHFDNRNGLSNSSINHIFRDENNLLWVATWDGLNMYDGNTFHVFNYSKENDFKGIGSNVIQQVTEDRQGNIWVTTIEGVSRYEKRTGRFYNYFYTQYQQGRVSEQEYSLAVDTAGKVYCLNQKTGLSFYDAKADTFKGCMPQQQFPVNKVAFDKSNRLWLLHSNGELEVFSGTAKHFTTLHKYKEATAISNFFTVGKELLFVTADDKLFTINSGNLAEREAMQMEHALTSLILYKDHYLLAWATKGYGVYDSNFQPSSFLKTETEQMQDIKVTSWALGSEDILWYGTDGNGVIKIYPKTKSFGTVATSENGMPFNKSVRAFCEANGNLWIGTKGSGIISLQNFWADTVDTYDKQYFLAPTVLDNNAVYALKKGKDELIYIGTDAKGIGVYDLQDKHFYKWVDIKGSSTVAEFGSVYAIKQDADNSLWLGTSGYGLIHVKINREKPGQLAVIFLQQFVFKNDNSGLANDIIYALADGATENQLWIGCRYGGLSLLDKTTLKFKTFKAFAYEGSLSNNDVLSLFKDKQNRIWIGTSYGLNWINNADAALDEPLFKKITTANGLPNNTIHGIAQDSAGVIWVSTNKGLANVGETGQKISIYQQPDGLQSNEFCDGAVWKDGAGTLFFGGTYGFNHFLPQGIQKSGWQPNLLLSGILMGGKTVDENGFVVLGWGKHQPLEFSIGRKDNFFELDIKAISFLNAEKCEYAYYLDGYDKEWQYSSTNGKINYSNVLPGNYTLKIKWSNGEGSWSPETALLGLEVKQYVWLRWYAWLLYASIVFGVAYILYSYRKNKQEIKHQLAVEHVLREKEEEIHQNRLGFFTNIAHELQTPLTLIMGSSERFLDKNISTAEQKNKPYFLSLIHQQASRLTYLVHQLLEFRKVEAGFFKNQYSRLNISELLQNLAEPFVPLSEQNKMDYAVDIAPDMVGWIDKDKVEKIIFNLLSNAFKHSGKQEQVVFSALENKQTGELEIKVVNSGIRLSEKELGRLFDKFYVVSPNISGNEKFGTGIGLAFTRQLVVLLNGRIEAKNENERIVFKVNLPLIVKQPEGIAGEDAYTVSDKPSYLYQTITAYSETANAIPVVENNKQAIIANLQDDNRKNVLIVEDDAHILFLLKDILKETYNIYEAGDGVKALSLIEKIIPDLVICDVMMPNMNGLELCNKMKNEPATCQIPFILLSARGSEEHHMEGYEVGADAYIAKPFHTAHLKLRIRKLLEYRQRLHDFFKNTADTDLLDEPGIPDSDKQFLTRLVHLIEQKLDEPELNAVFLEKEFCMSKMQLYRKLKTLTGMTPGEFIKQLRIKTAAKLLVSTNLNVTEIFFRTGFNNQSYFFREFKKMYNCSPNEYREQQVV